MNKGSIFHSTHKPRMPRTWWLQRREYFLFMMRELSALWIGLFVTTYLVGLYRLYQGKEHYQGYLEALQGPTAKIFFTIVLAFSLYHTVTWFNLTPIVLVLRIGKKVIPELLVLIASYVAWGGLSGFLIYLLLNV